MADEKNVFELDDLLVRPGTYFNPQTEVIVVVDDSATVDQEVFNMEPYEGADWVRITDEVPVDSDKLETALERFQTINHPGSDDLVFEVVREGDEEVEPEEELEPDADPEELA
jgi:hypothetical protein